jgi:hypothetical protein
MSKVFSLLQGIQAGCGSHSASCSVPNVGDRLVKLTTHLQNNWSYASPLPRLHGVGINQVQDILFYKIKRVSLSKRKSKNMYVGTGGILPTEACDELHFPLPSSFTSRERLRVKH